MLSSVACTCGSWLAITRHRTGCGPASATICRRSCGGWKATCWSGSAFVARVYEVVFRVSVSDLGEVHVPTGREWHGRRDSHGGVHWEQRFRSADPGAARRPDGRLRPGRHRELSALRPGYPAGPAAGGGMREHGPMRLQDLHRAPAGGQLRHAPPRRQGDGRPRLRRVLPLRPLPQVRRRVRRARPVRRLDHPGRPCRRDQQDPARHAGHLGDLPVPGPARHRRRVRRRDERRPRGARHRRGLVRGRARRLRHPVPAGRGSASTASKSNSPSSPASGRRRPARSSATQGTHYQVTDSPALPKPVQRPRPPVIIGGHGPRRTPALAARYADEFNIAFSSVGAAAAQFGRVREACAAAGRDPAALVYSAAQTVCCGKDEATLSRRAASIGRDVAELRAQRPGRIAGRDRRQDRHVRRRRRAGLLPPGPRPRRPRPPGRHRRGRPAPGVTGRRPPRACLRAAWPGEHDHVWTAGHRCRRRVSPVRVTCAASASGAGRCRAGTALRWPRLMRRAEPTGCVPGRGVGRRVDGPDVRLRGAGCLRSRGCLRSLRGNLLRGTARAIGARGRRRDRRRGRPRGKQLARPGREPRL